MKNQIAIATARTARQISQSFVVASYWNDHQNEGVMLVNTQNEHNKYAVWTVNFAGERFYGYYADDYSEVATDYDMRVKQIMRHEAYAD